MGEKKKPDEVNEDVLEKSFNDALAGLNKALGIDTDEGDKITKEDLNKAVDEDDEDVKKKKTDSEDEEPEDEDEEPDDDEDEEGMKKSMEDLIKEDPEAEASMDVAPFLETLVKSFDTAIGQLHTDIKKQGKQIDAQGAIIKAQGTLLKAQADLSKSTKDIVKKIGEAPIQTTSVKRLQKSRFDAPEGSDDAPMEFNGVEILQKSTDWLKTEKISLVDAGVIESRINKGTLGKFEDSLDKTVIGLLREEK